MKRPPEVEEYERFNYPIIYNKGHYSGPQTYPPKSKFDEIPPPKPFGTFGVSKRFTLTDNMKDAGQCTTASILFIILFSLNRYISL